MKVFKELDHFDLKGKKVVLTIGNFDGVHLGHRELLAAIVKKAKELGAISAVLTFRPHPQVLLGGGKEKELINSYEEKIHLFQDSGVDCVLEQSFSREFSNTSPEEFFDKILIGKIGVHCLYLGYDFAFGKERAGSVELMQRFAKNRGVEVQVVAAMQLHGTIVSSSNIRRFLEEGKVEEASALLGRNFFLKGLVWRGEGRGRKIGIPTANLKIEKRKVPKFGVYVTKTLWKQKWFSSVTNLGFNPTFREDSAESPLKIETHIFGFQGEMYGDEIQVDFLKYLRSEQKFSGVEELLKQIHADMDAAKRYFEKHRV